MLNLLCYDIICNIYTYEHIPQTLTSIIYISKFYYLDPIKLHIYSDFYCIYFLPLAGHCIRITSDFRKVKVKMFNFASFRLQ